MTKDDKDVDSVVLRAVSKKIGADRFDVWFENKIQLELRPDRLEVGAPSRFYADRLSAMFGGALAEVAKEVSGAECRVVFKVVDNSVGSSRSGGNSLDLRVASTEQSSNESQVRGGDPDQPRSARRFKTLDSFVVGDSNRLAWTGARSAISHPGGFSPLLFWGPPGTGKTHLLEGIWSELRRRRCGHVLYLTAEQFTTMFLQALHGRGLPSFRSKCRTVDVLLIDDVQFFSNKRATLVELQHTVDALARDGKQLVLSADRLPGELSGLGNELVTRLCGGLICGLQLPDEKTRTGIVRRFLTDNKTVGGLGPWATGEQETGSADQRDGVPRGVAEAIASEIPGDARQLCGAVNQVVATARSKGTPLTPSLVQEALSELASTIRQAVGLEEIEHAVCEVFGLKPHMLQSDKRSKNVTQPRMLAMWLARRYTSAVYAEIGEYFGRRSHSTVIAAQKKVGQWMADESMVNLAGTDCRVQEAVRRVETRLRLA